MGPDGCTLAGPIVAGSALAGDVEISGDPFRRVLSDRRGRAL